MKNPSDLIPKNVRTYSFLVCLAVSVIAHGQSPVSSQWPRVISRNGVTNTIYQPQLESWDYFTLKATSAVEIQSGSAPQDVFGSIDFAAKTRVDRAEREVYFEDIQITHGTFPSAGAQADAYLTTLRSLLPTGIKSISLDRLEASLAILEARRKGAAQPLKNDPPAIIFSTQPAMLILVDGPAVYHPVEKTDLERILNTRALILREKSGRHYLHLFDGYVEASDLRGPWTIASKVPDGISAAEKQAVAAKQVDLLAGQENPETKRKPSLKSTPLPVVHVVDVPTELVVTHGEPAWSPVPMTQLLCLTNTASHVFKEIENQQTYLLISGRWFRAPSFAGPWEFVPGANLPKDFTNIPDDSAQENVKAAVLGTRQAQESNIANDIPQIVKVDRKKARVYPLPQYDGEPQLTPIEGTSLLYVANCPLPVIKVDDKDWYSCQNGIWFVATDPKGPWVAATNVPAVIYSIPPNSPMHYVVYSRVYNYDQNYIWVGTSPGFYGTMVGPDGVVVYGTGYSYAPYIGSTIYVSYPLTYGYGCNPCWTPWAGWAFGFGVGWAMENDWYWWVGCLLHPTGDLTGVHAMEPTTMPMAASQRGDPMAGRGHPDISITKTAPGQV